MEKREVIRRDGTRGVLDAGAIEEVRSTFGDRAILPGDPAYEGARRVWNGMIDRCPAMIVPCRGPADVIAAVRFARDRNLVLAVRGGGHNVAGFGTCDGGLVIDLSPMRGVRVDPEAKTVRVEAGATLGDVDRETQVFDLAVPGGIVSTTGIAGLTLGGGQGWFRRTFGMTCESLLSVDVVTADGALVTADRTRNPDLFWAVRGGGGNFGVVTSFEFRAHPLGPRIAFAGPAYPAEQADEVMAALRDFAEGAEDRVNASATWWTVPPIPAFPEEAHGRAVIVLGATYAGPPEEGTRALQPLREAGTPVLDLSGTLPYLDLQRMFDPFFPAGDLFYYWKSMYLAGLDRGTVETLARFMNSRPSSLSMAGIWALGGALDRADPEGTAAGACRAPFLLEILANWAGPDGTEANVAWAREFFEAMGAHGTGRTNLNFPGLGEDDDFVRAALGGHWDRLVEVKRKYDPDNVFRLNQNIDPRG